MRNEMSATLREKLPSSGLFDCQALPMRCEDILPVENLIFRHSGRQRQKIRKRLTNV